MIKPFGQMELLAKVKSVMRRLRPMDGEPNSVCGPFRFAYSMRKVYYLGKEISLTTTEGLILQTLAENAGKTVNHSSLACAVWGEDYPGAVDSLKVYIRRLRTKLEEDPGRPKLIISKPGVGYFLAKSY
jgi:two-component system KDP operon response regulator KdpE